MRRMRRKARRYILVVFFGVWWWLLVGREGEMCMYVCVVCIDIAPAQDSITINHDKYLSSSAQHVVVVVERWSIKERSKMAIVDSR